MYKVGERNQITLFPERIEDYVGANDPVRVYNAFVEAIDFDDLGIPLEPYKSGAHEYHPCAMLKLLIYGYSYGIRSSRKLEQSCHHNLSFIWLTEGLKPDYRTIARFRSEHKEAIKKVLKQTVRLCIEFKLIEGNKLFTDSSVFRANAGIGNTWTMDRCDKYLRKINEEIDRLVEEAEQIDQSEDGQGSLVKIKEEINDGKVFKKKIEDIAKDLRDSQKNSINTTDKDSVKAKGRQGTHAGYKGQITADEKYGLIVNSEAVSQNHDKDQFSKQVKQAEEVIGHKPDVVCSDSGYYDLEDIKKVPSDIKVIIPSPKEVHQERGKEITNQFDKDKFRYDKEKDEYICPEGRRLTYIGIGYDDERKRVYQADGKGCLGCAKFGICTKSKKGRKVIRMVEEEVKEILQETYRSEFGQAIYKLRKEKVELPFGHIKRNLGAWQFLLRGRKGVDTELSILSVCFNIARMITLLGVNGLISMLEGYKLKFIYV